MFSRRSLYSLGCVLAAVAVAGALLHGRADAASFVPQPIAASASLPELGELGSLVGADGRLHVFVELDGPPAAVVYAGVLTEAGHTDAASIAHATAAARAQIAANQAAQDVIAAQLAASPIAAQEIYRLSKVANGLVVRVAPEQRAVIERLPGVRAATIVLPEEPSNSTSVPFIGAPPAWGNTLGLGQSLTGTGMTIGIIDTGIDYQHSNFGGTGLLADYQANDRTVAPDAFFPSAKVAGGFDFAGDTYNAGGNGGSTGSTVPAPDPDPMDCNSHGTHVAGTAAGLGVNADGTTFAGPYDTAVPFGTLRLGPGVAPQATLYGLRVFGCQGSTTLTASAIEWAADPDDDGDFSDRLDVVNLSLGSNFGNVNDLSAQAAENASLVGLIVVAASGNAGDTYFITSSPGVATHAINVAASLDGGLTGALLTVNSPAAIAGGYTATGNTFTDPNPPAPPAPAGQTANVIAAIDPADGAGPLTTDACSALTNAAAVAGNICLVDRGTCGFAVKALNCQAAGAIGTLVANNVAGDPVPIVMGGAAAADVNIPAIQVSQATGNLIRAQLAIPVVVNATLVNANPGDTMATFSSRGPRRRTTDSHWLLKPEISAPGQTITSSFTGVLWNGATCVGGCVANFQAGNLTLNNNGTSMATPHVAGVMALLKQRNPTWTVEELKALLMNYSTDDIFLGANETPPRFGLSREGAGRADVSKTAVGQVVAMSADDPGAVAVSFGTEIIGNQTRLRTVRVVNHGATAQTYDLGIDTVINSPGVSFSLPGGSSVTVPAGGTASFDVQLSADAGQMDNAFDATVAAGQAVSAPAGFAALGSVARHRLNEEAGFVTFSQGATLRFRLPVYSAPRPASVMSAGDIVTGGAGTGSTTIPLSGTDLCTGTLGAGPACTGSFPTDEVSLVSPFELQIVSPRDPGLIINKAADLQYVGVAADAAGTNLFFGVATYADWSSPNEVNVNIWIDNNEDGTWDRVVFNSSLGQVSRFLFGSAANNPQDNYLSFLFTPPGTVASQFFINATPATVDTELFGNNVMVIPITAASIGLTAGNNDFRYRVETCPLGAPLCSALPAFTVGAGLDDSGPGFVTWNRTARGLTFGGILFEDLNGDTVPVTWNTANMTATGSLGALLLHHHNASGNRAEVVLLDTAPRADLALTKSMSPATPALGQNVTFTLTLSNQGPDTAINITVFDALPAGLTYVSDNGAGAYNSATGVWTVPGPLLNGGSTSLQIVATVDTTTAILNTATISTAVPLDPDSSDNSSSVLVNAPETADLELSMTAAPLTVNPGDPFTIDLTAANNGDDTAFSINVNEVFSVSEPLAPTASTASVGTYNPATGIWLIPSLGSQTDATATLSLTFTAPNIAGALTNNGTLTATVADPDNANNSDSVTINVLSPSAVSATKTVAGTLVTNGGGSYTVVLTNNGTFTQQDNPGPEFTDTVPLPLGVDGATATSGTATVVGNTVNWNGSIPPSGSVTITIDFTIPVTAVQAMPSNQGTVNFDGDGNGSNESTAQTDDPGQPGAADPTVFLVLSPADVFGQKTVLLEPLTYAIGQTVIYEVRLFSNTFAQLDNPGDEFVDVLPPELQLVSATATGGTVVANTATNTVTWNGVLAIDDDEVITIEAIIVGGNGPVLNQGTINYDADGNYINDSTRLTDDPAIGGTTDPTEIIVGAQIEIPTLSELGLGFLVLALLGVGLFVLRRRG